MIGQHKVSEVISRLEEIFKPEKDLLSVRVDYTSENVRITFSLYEYIGEICFIADWYNLMMIKIMPEITENVIEFDDGFETLDDLMLYLAHVYA